VSDASSPSFAVEAPTAAPVASTDDTGAVLYGNRRFSAMFDRGDEPRTGRDVAARLVAVRGASGATATGAEVRDSRDGRRYRMQSSVIPWVGLTRVELHVLSDVTEETVEAGLHDAARAAVRHAARVSDMGETASILAHELNQPLVALVGYNSACLRLLETEPLDRAALTAALEKGRGQALRAGEIVHRLRELARRRAPQVAASDLNAIVRQQLAAMAPEIARADVELETSFAAGLDDIDCDGVLVGQVVRNLVDNGIDAMWDCPHGARRLLVATEPLPEHGVRITVADRGHGVTAAVAERMYTPFFTTRSTGLGLGLSICRSIAEAHHGRLWHSPRAAGGTAFHFTLP
jgi:signal transduction histidine kinase